MKRYLYNSVQNADESQPSIGWGQFMNFGRIKYPYSVVTQLSSN